jgi:hypothetical protein
MVTHCISGLYRRLRGAAFGRKRQFTKIAPMAAMGVRRAKAAFLSGCKSHPATFAPAGSNRSSHGGNEVAEASGVEGHLG